jgi:hypothetical protein
MLNAGKPEGQPTREPFHWALEFPEVFLEEGASQGFSAIVGNPPFVGGTNLTGIFGTDYREFIVKNVADKKRGNADLCAFFFLRSYQALNLNAFFGMLATNTISQGDTREVGLDQLVSSGVVHFSKGQRKRWALPVLPASL